MVCMKCIVFSILMVLTYFLAWCGIKHSEGLDKKDVGISEGDICWRDDCLGTIQKVDGSCTCHMGNPPCGYCVDAPHYCDTCTWEE